MEAWKKREASEQSSSESKHAVAETALSPEQEKAEGEES